MKTASSPCETPIPCEIEITIRCKIKKLERIPFSLKLLRTNFIFKGEIKGKKMSTPARYSVR